MLSHWAARGHGAWIEVCELSNPLQGRRIRLTILAPRFALCRLASSDEVPAWTALATTFLTISRSSSELSIVADEAAVPGDVRAERGYRALRVEGPMPLEWVGIMAALAVPLAEAGVSIFPIATWDTDYILVREDALALAVTSLERAGHEVTGARVEPAV